MRCEEIIIVFFFVFSCWMSFFIRIYFFKFILLNGLLRINMLLFCNNNVINFSFFFILVEYLVVYLLRGSWKILFKC